MTTTHASDDGQRARLTSCNLLVNENLKDYPRLVGTHGLVEFKT